MKPADCGRVGQEAYSSDAIDEGRTVGAEVGAGVAVVVAVRESRLVCWLGERESDGGVGKRMEEEDRNENGHGAVWALVFINDRGILGGLEGYGLPFGGFFRKYVYV